MSVVIEELVKMHSSIQPLRTLHIGGDEVPGEAWEESPRCQSFMQKIGVGRSVDSILEI